MGFQYRTFKTCAFAFWPVASSDRKELGCPPGRRVCDRCGAEPVEHLARYTPLRLRIQAQLCSLSPPSTDLALAGAISVNSDPSSRDLAPSSPVRVRGSQRTGAITAAPSRESRLRAGSAASLVACVDEVGDGQGGRVLTQSILLVGVALNTLRDLGLLLVK